MTNGFEVRFRNVVKYLGLGASWQLVLRQEKFIRCTEVI